MLIRHTRRNDLPTIVEIYNQAIPSKQSTADTQPLHVEDRVAWFAERHPKQHTVVSPE